MIGYLLKGFQLTCIAGEEYGRRNAGISVVSMPRIFRFAKQMQHHADKTGQYGYTRQCPKSILIPRPRRRQLEAEQMPLMVQLLLQVAVHRERALAAAAPAPTTTSSATTIVKVVPRMLAAARSGCVPRRGPGILFGHRRYVTRYEQYGGRSSRTCSRRRHQDALRAAA